MLLRCFVLIGLLAAVAMAETPVDSGWSAMHKVALVSVQEPGETFASGIHLPNQVNVGALEQQVLDVLKQSGRSVVDMPSTQDVLKSDDFYRAVERHLPTDDAVKTLMDVKLQYSSLSGDMLKDVLASKNTSVALNMFAHQAETRFRNWFAPSIGPLLGRLGADGFVLVGSSPELDADYRHGSRGVRINSGYLRRVGTHVCFWIGDVRGNVLATMEEISFTSDTGPERFQIDTAVQETQKMALDELMKSLASDPPQTPHVPGDDDSRD